MATQAKSNIAISNDCISGVFTPNVIVTINGTDRSTAVRMESVRITLNRNDQPDSATLIINRDGGFTPAAGQTIGIALGDALNYIFAGQLVDVRYLRANTADLPDFEVICTDWEPLFNRRLITFDFSGLSATSIANTIVDSYTSGFSTYGIEAGLDTIDEFICINETPLGALRRLANILGGGCDIYPSKIVALWGTAGRTSVHTPSPPATLTNALSTLKSFTPEYDFSQIRTRVIVEGKSTTCPLSFAANAFDTWPDPGNSIPVEDSSAFSASGGVARIGTQRVTYTSRNYPVVPGLNAEGTFVTADTAAGSSSIAVDSNAFELSTGTEWVQVGDQILWFSSSTPTSLAGIPTSGVGSIQHAIGSGESVRALGLLQGVSGLTLAQDAGVEVVVMSEEDDAAAQAAVAALEGGDGIHEHIVTDGRLSAAGCEERALAELAAFSAALDRASWTTHDLQTVAGAEQATNITSPTFNTTLTIDSVSIDFPVDNTSIASSPAATCDANRWPRRVAQGSTVKLENILDAITG
jgi:hypothetical protein